MTAKEFHDKYYARKASGISSSSGGRMIGLVRNWGGGQIFIVSHGDMGAWCDFDTVRLVDDAPKPAQDERLTPTSVRLPDYFKNHPARDVGPAAPLAGLEDAAARRFKELTAPLVMAMEETLAHLHTVSAYVRNEKQFSATHAAVTRRVAQALREHKGGK